MRIRGSTRDSLRALVKREASELGGAPHGQLGGSHAVDGFEFLGVYGTVAVDEVGAELFELGGILKAHDGEAGGGEAVFGGVLGRPGFALRRSGAGTFAGVGAIDSDLMSGGGLALPAFGFLSGLVHDGLSHGSP